MKHYTAISSSAAGAAAMKPLSSRRYMWSTSSMLLIFTGFAFIVLKISTLFASSHSTMSQEESKEAPLTTQQVAEFGMELQQLRSIKGHWDGGEYNQDIDGFQGRKHVLLTILGKELGKPGTPAVKIFELLGQPDKSEALDSMVTFMPGPKVPKGTTTASQASTNTLVLVYNWRSNHDFLWFKIDTVTETVLESGWWMAME
ncbi:hypothetical protein BDV3_000122 [Batrachochytrium dendrobatidis]|nr:hypothetical protein O5D80_004414 [Batrachochytrium dendrobatidis]KAK5668217.1 hypothetical protein QVD99_005254 [Batrachochytrium dendrobatidis]